MTSFLSPDFFKRYKALPKNVQGQARANYKLWKNDPSHPSLEYKEIPLRSGRSVWSARITSSYRVLGSLKDEEMVRIAPTVRGDDCSYLVYLTPPAVGSQGEGTFSRAMIPSRYLRIEPH